MVMNAIGPSHLESFFAEQNYSVPTRATAINRLSTLFAFAERRGYIERNPVDRLDRIILERKPPAILSPAAAAQMLAVAKLKEAALLGYLVLGLFCGIRPAEMDRMDWSSVDRGRGIIRIDAAASKIRRRRLVLMPSAAVAWLHDVPAVGAVSPKQKQRRLQRLAVRLEIEHWPHDILRHSAASYLLALHQDAGKVAMWLGNSPGILLRHYHELVSPEDCAAFWAIRP